MKTVLLVDDDKVNRDMVKIFLDFVLPDCLIKEASNGQEAIELLKVKKFDLVITDFNMPGADGVDVIAFIARKYEEYPWIVVMSGRVDEFREAFKHRVGAGSKISYSIELLSKPFDLSALLAAMPKKQ